MSNRFIKRSMEIVGESLKETGKEYTSNIWSLLDDAKEIKNSFIKSAQDASEMFSRIKSTDMTKKISDWFYSKEQESDAAFASDDDEFDAGFKLDSSDDDINDSTEKSSSFNIDSISDISEKQNGVMYKIGRRQTEQSVINTSEIISSLNSRSSEMLASINNVNKSLIGISDRIDRLIQLTVNESKEDRNYGDKNELIKNGELSLSGIWNTSKNNVSNSMIVNSLRSVLDMAKVGAFTPEGLFDISKSFILDAKMNALGGKSINDLGKDLNDAIGSISQIAMSEIISSKHFKKLFGDITSMSSDQDYSRFNINTYNTKRATFDEMTRMSIIKVIPEMLGKINESISGINYHVDNQGNLKKGVVENKFGEVTHSLFSSSGLTQSASKQILKNAQNIVSSDVSTDDIDKASKALATVIAVDMHTNGKRIFKVRDFTEDTLPYIEMATEVLLNSLGNSREYWAKICQIIIHQMSSNKIQATNFVKNINNSLENMMRDATDYASSGKANAIYAGKITQTMAFNEFKKREGNRNLSSDNSSIGISTITDGNISNNVNKINADSYSMHDYLRGIYSILNRGINVKTTNKRNDTKGYRPFDLRNKTLQQSSENDNIAGEVFANMFMGGKDTDDNELISNAVKNAVNVTKEALLGTSSSEGNNVNIRGGQGLFGNMLGLLGVSGIQSMTRRFVSGDLTSDVRRAFDEVRYDPMTGELTQGGIRKSLQDVKKSFNSTMGKVKDTTQFISDNISDRISDETKGKIDRVGNTMFGDSIGYDSKGNLIRRQNGLVHVARDKTIDFVGNTADKIADGTNKITNRFTSHLQLMQDNSDVKNLRNMLNNGSSDYSDDDIALAKQVMNSASRMSSRRWNNGNSQQDMMSRIDSISDLNLREQVSQASTTLTNRNVSSTGRGGISDFMVEHDIKGKAESVLDIVKKGFSVVGKTLSKIAETLADIAKDGLRNIYYGLTSMKEGLFGAKKRDGDGNIIYDENGKAEREHGLVRNFIELPGTVASSIKNKLSNKNTDEESDKPSLLDRTGDVLHNVHEIFNNVGEIIKDKFIDITEYVKDGFSNTFEHIKNFGSKFFSKEEETIYDPETGEAITRKKGLIPRAGDAFRKTSFGSGFMSGFDKAKEAKEAAKEKEEREGSFINRTTGSILDILTGKEQGGSLLNQILDMMDNIRTDMNSNHEEEMNMDNNDADDVINETSTIDSGQVEGPDIQTINSSSEVNQISTSSSTINTGGTSISASTMSSGSSSESDDINNGSNSGGGVKSLVKDMMGGLGKMMGGFSQALMGIWQLVASVVMSMEGLSAIKELVESIFTDGLQPLNDVFESVADLIEPIVDTLKTMVGTIAETVVTIAESLLDTIQPIMEAIQPIIETLLDVLKPILELVTVLTEAIMAPLLIAIKAMEPIIESIGYSLEAISGVLSLGMGSVITLLGSLLTGVGYIVKFLTHDDGLVQQGKSMLKTGKDLMSSGVSQIKEGVTGELDLIKRFIPGGESPIASENKKDDIKNKPTIDTSEIELKHTTEGTVYGSGDNNNYYTSYEYNNTYGSGNSTIMNQHSYGSYMNMGERGCGPVALADAFSRRTGMTVNPLTLASKMVGNGSYDPNRGTSVGSFIRTSNSLGMGLQLGGVTASSLKRATPTNPITLLGSGAEYGTRRGNDHYVNVIGTDRRGGAYVANPLTGRISRTSASTLALNSRLGLYGSGDSDDSFYKFDDETSEALEGLKNLTSKLTTMFTGDSTGDKITSKIEAGEDENKAIQIKRRLGDDFEEYEKKALEMFMSDNPKRDGESDEAYNARIEKAWGKSSNYNKYIIKAGGEEAYNRSKGILDGQLSSSQKVNEDMDSFAESMSSLDISMSSSIDSSNGSIESETGAIMAPYNPINYTEASIDSATSGKSPVHDFFSATSGSKAYTKDGGWYQRGKAPVSKQGVGTTGDRTGGINISFSDPNKGGELHAITGGTAVYVTRSGKHGKTDPNGGLGNAVKWRDDSGMYHWYLHMADVASNIQENSTIQPGQLLGHVGNTGYTESKNDKHLHYIVTSAGPKGNTGDDGYINPLTYWKFVEKATGGKEGKINLTSTLSNGSAWSFHKNHSGVPKFVKIAQESGMTPAQIATIMSTGIWEDGGEKLWGSKSLVNVTYDYNGQQATGIMNWVDTNVNYGKTVPDQLDYIRRTYFDESSNDWRATSKKNGYESADLAAFKAATGRSGWKLNFGEKYGPYMEEDLVEGSDHFFRVALVPECIHTASGVGKYVGTAADIYNWMIDQGYASGGGTTSTGDNSINGQFVSTVKNKTVGTGNSDDVIKSLAMIYEAYIKKVPSGTYGHYDSGSYTLRDGSTIDHLRPDCSGLVSAAIKHMGYKLKGDYGTGVMSEVFAGASSNTVVLDPDGTPSKDWQIFPASGQTYQAGDITNTFGGLSSWWPCAHSSMPLLDVNGYTKGFDGGGTTNIKNSAQAAIKYLDGDNSYVSCLHSAMDPKSSNTILRYVGGKKEITGEGSKPGTFNNSALYNGTSVDNINISSKSSYEINSNTNSKDKETYSSTTTGNVIKAINKKGSGDTPSIEPWYDSLISDNMFDIQPNATIPDLDESRLIDEYSERMTTPNGVIVQKYEIKSDSSDKIELLNKLNKMTFNVRAERIEQLLEKIISIMDNNNSTKTNYSIKNNNNYASLFDNDDIPAQVALLARG